MSNDNDPRDEAMREIEAALEHYAMVCIDEIGDGTPECYERTNAVKGKLLALIRSKLPQPDAEHERAVEAWESRAMALPMAGSFVISGAEFDEALRLMRARPASDWEQRFYALADKVKCRAPSCGDIDCGLGEIDDKLEAAGELLRAAKALLDESDIIQCDNPSVVPRFLDAIAKAERAGIKQ